MRTRICRTQRIKKCVAVERLNVVDAVYCCYGTFKLRARCPGVRPQTPPRVACPTSSHAYVHVDTCVHDLSSRADVLCVLSECATRPNRSLACLVSQHGHQRPVRAAASAQQAAGESQLLLDPARQINAQHDNDQPASFNVPTPETCYTYTGAYGQQMSENIPSITPWYE